MRKSVLFITVFATLVSTTFPAFAEVETSEPQVSWDPATPEIQTRNEELSRIDAQQVEQQSTPVATQQPIEQPVQQVETQNVQPVEQSNGVRLDVTGAQLESLGSQRETFVNSCLQHVGSALITEAASVASFNGRVSQQEQIEHATQISVTNLVPTTQEIVNEEGVAISTLTGFKVTGDVSLEGGEKISTEVTLTLFTTQNEEGADISACARFK